jgi:RimJ/RimL family protein N-acetyltransferase
MVTPEDNDAATSGCRDDVLIFRMPLEPRPDKRAVGNDPEAGLPGVIHPGLHQRLGDTAALDIPVDVGVPEGEDSRPGFPVVKAAAALGETHGKAVAVGLVFDGHGGSRQWTVKDRRREAVNSIDDLPLRLRPDFARPRHEPAACHEAPILVSVPVQFTTARLRAERLREAHHAELRVFHQNPEMMALIGGLRDDTATQAYLERHLAQWRDCGFGFYLLRDLATGTAVGTAGLRRLPLDGVAEVEVGYGFLPACWGMGLGTEIAAACVEQAFGALDAPSVVALTDPAHVASQRVLAKVGLAFDRDLIREDRPMALFRGMRG